MGEFHGSFRMVYDGAPGMRVVIDLDQEQILIKSEAGVLGRWPMGDIGIRGEDDGFHLRIEGEEAVFASDDDVGFARAVGLQAASPRLRRRMGASFHES
jgi:hypothetical protein